MDHSKGGWATVNMLDNLTSPVATLLVGLLSLWVLLHVHRTNALRSAASAFRTTVFSQLEGLYPLASVWPSDIDAFLRQRFPRLQAAVIEFRHFLPWWERRAFDSAWLRFHNAYERKGEQCYHHYMAFGSTTDPEGIFKRNVDVLLSFAKQP